MTKTAKTATAAALALVSSIALMLLMRPYGADHHSRMMEGGSFGTRPMTAMWGEMGWLMALGPVAGILFFGGIVTFVVLLVRSLAKSD